MGSENKEEENQENLVQEQQHKKKSSLRSKAAHFVSDVATVILNPISDKPLKPRPPPLPEDGSDSEGSKHDSYAEEDAKDLVDGPDTSSFTAFLYSLLSTTGSDGKSNISGKQDESTPEPIMKEPSRRKSILSRGKQSLGRAFHGVARLGGFRNQGSAKGSSEMVFDDGSNSKVDDQIPLEDMNQKLPPSKLPETSEPSMLLSEKARSTLYAALPVLVQDRKWVLLYSTWRNGISLSTLYRRSLLWHGISLLVVGDRNGAVFGGLVDAPLRATTKRRYQGTNNSFVFSNVSGQPVIFRPTGVNRYFTVCSTEYLALGGGGHFALYLDGDLLTGSSATSETYGNSCLAHTEDFEVKEVELWGFVYASKYEEMVSLLRTEAPGICRW
ncbi:oxidation resistance protein 1 [Nicotiana tabacum]|uniref:Oxidation resistance protein 1 n=1 Tax=Nicotiana tabacum TaxID=4097 RepID=A0A1S4C6S3_TOBAC|nr:oxidation resistance protein 1 [Nicotiana tomentosiformis]XP_016496823.1 PREDICTED: oxidation resistance protein 1-like [Nicotiana tabacum]